MSLNADAIFAKIQTAGDDWADKKAAFCALDDMTSTVRADLATDYYASCGSKGEAVERALASPRMKDHLASVAGARRAWLLAEVKFKNLQLLAELRRSEESTRRAEMGMR
jgi:hypothetical protein